MADFFGNRWQVNAILIPTPHGSGKPYLQPVGHVMRLFGKYRGEYAVDVCGGHEADVTASVEEDGTILLHLVNPNMNRPLTLEIEREDGMPVRTMTAHEIAPDDATEEITPQNAGCFEVMERRVDGNGYLLPPAAISVLVIPPTASE